VVKPIPYPAVLDFFVSFPDVSVQFGNSGVEFVNDRFEKDAIIKTLLDVCSE